MVELSRWVGLLAIASCVACSPFATVEQTPVEPILELAETATEAVEIGKLAEEPDGKPGSESAGGVEPEFLIDANSIGPARLGMTLAELRQELGDRLTVGEPETFIVDFDAIPVLDGDEVLFYIMYGSWEPLRENDAIQYLATENPRYRTAAGIGPGSTIAQAEAVYGKPTLGYNIENESRESVQFENWPLSNSWVRPEVISEPGNFAGIYDKSESSSYQETNQYRDDAVIGSITIDLRQ